MSIKNHHPLYVIERRHRARPGQITAFLPASGADAEAAAEAVLRDRPLEEGETLIAWPVQAGVAEREVAR